MKKILLILVLLIGIGPIQPTIFAQKVKVKESSQKKKPDWVNGMVKGYIITMANGSSLENAQQKALEKVKEQIISSVAENIQTSTEYYRSEEIKGNQSEFEESLRTNTKTKTADIPFVKGISASKVDEYYWEKQSINKEISYSYHIKYGFSAIQLKKLITEYEEADAALSKSLDASIEKIEQAQHVEEIQTAIKELEALKESFIEMDVRNSQSNVAISNAKSLLKNLSIIALNETIGELKLVLVSGDRQLETKRKPLVKSNCAKILSVKSNKGIWVIQYAYDECYADPDNKLFVEFKNSYGRANSEFYFNINAEKVELFINGPINLMVDNHGTTVNASLPLHSKYESAFTVNKVVLRFAKNTPLIIDNINQSFEGKGDHLLKLSFNLDNLGEYASNKVPMIHGSMHYTSNKKGTKNTLKIFNQRITTNW